MALQKPKFNTQITLGNIIQIGLIIIGLLFGYADVNERVNANTTAIVTESDMRTEAIKSLREMHERDNGYTREELKNINAKLDRLLERKD